MDFARVLDVLVGFMDERHAPYAVIGGVGMAAYGMVRTTLDVDLVVPGEQQDALIAFLESQGYATLHRSTGYSNHLHRDTELGRVDLVYVRGDTGRELFAAVRPVPGPGGRELRVPCPEHLAAMKAFAMKNDPARSFREMEDIRYLMTLPGVDRARIRGYFEKHGLEARFAEIEATL